VTGGTCQPHLLAVLSESNCELEPPLLVTSEGQLLASQVLQGLQTLGASDTCIMEAAPFLCLYAYGLCSSTGVYLQPSSSQCEEVRDNLCSFEWATALQFGIALPSCEQFSSEAPTCLTSNETDTLGTTEESESEGE